MDGGTDCDDTNADINSAAEEVYDGVDNDCVDGDETDIDEDGYDGFPVGDDCDDTNAEINPGAQRSRARWTMVQTATATRTPNPATPTTASTTIGRRSTAPTPPTRFGQRQDPRRHRWGPGDEPVNTSDVGESSDEPIYDVLDDDSDDDGVLDKYEWLGRLTPMGTARSTRRLTQRTASQFPRPG